MKATYKNFLIRSKFTGSKQAPWGNYSKKLGLPENWNHNRVTVKNTETGKQTGFDFWGSIVNPEPETEYAVLNAFYCFVSDAVIGDMEFAEFCREFGYDEDSRKAEKTWKACQRATVKLERIYDGDVGDLANELQEVAG